MQKFWLKITNNKGNPIFWPILAVLWIASLFYRFGWFVKYHMTSPTVKTAAPVVSVGNLTVGGTGKTPMVLELARHFLAKGKSVGIVSSGYGRKNNRNIIGSGGDLCSSSILDLGDEVMMMVNELPDVYFSIAESKSEAARILDESHALDVIIVDDGYQHRRLYRDYDILLMEAGADLREKSLFPLGPLREPLECIDRADAVIITKTNFGSSADKLHKWLLEKYPRKIKARTDYINENAISADEKVSVDEFADKKVYFFAGIGGFEPLLNHLKSCFGNIVGYRQFSDHCCYRPSDAAGIKADLDRLNPEYAVTTYKDYVKLRSFDFGQLLYYLDLRLVFVSGEDALRKALDKVVE